MCGYMFKNKKCVDEHERRYNGQYRNCCSGNGFVSRADLVRHKKTITAAIITRKQGVSARILGKKHYVISKKKAKNLPYASDLYSKYGKKYPDEVTWVRHRCTNKNINLVYGLFNIDGTTRRHVSDFMKTMLSVLDLTSENSKIGLVEKCIQAEKECGEFDSADLFGYKIDAMIANDMPDLIYSIRTSHLPSMFEDDDYRSYVILFISGEINDIRTSYLEALRLKHRAEVLVIGVDNSVDRSQLKKLASYKNRSKPDVSHVFPVGRPEVLLKIVKKVSALFGKRCA